MDVEKYVSHEVYIGAWILLVESSIVLSLNIFVGYLLHRSSKTLTPSNYIYAHLIATDTLFSLMVLPYHLYHIIARAPFSYYWCQIGGFSAQCLAGVCVLLLLQILNPFWIIVLERPALTVKQIGWCIAFIWIYIGFITSSFIWISGDEYKLMPSGLWCHLNFRTPRWGTIIVLYCTLWVLVTNPFLIGGAYYLMWKKMNITGRQQKREREKKLEWIIGRKGTFLTVSFFLIWSYPASVLLWRYFAQWEDGPWSDFMIVVFGFMANMSNSLILLVTDDKIRAECNILLDKLGSKRNRNVIHQPSQLLLLQKRQIGEERDPTTVQDSTATATELFQSKTDKEGISVHNDAQVLSSLSESDIASTIPATVLSASQIQE